MVYHDVNEALTVTGTTTETPGYRSVFFARPRNFTFEPGDWMEISLADNQPPGGTAYSFSSSPDEPELRITFRDGRSPFKQVLQSLRAGDTLVMTEYGNDYGFVLHEHRASTLIAGGVGVAPFRSMLKQMADQGSRNSVELVYFNTSDEFLFRRELDAWQAQLPGLSVRYVPTQDLKRKDREKLMSELVADSKRQFYLSGPSGMVRSAKLSLQMLGVADDAIKVDDFGHY